MSKKALVIVGLAAVIAASTGVALASGDESHLRGSDADPVSSEVVQADGADPDTEDNVYYENYYPSDDDESTAGFDANSETAAEAQTAESSLQSDSYEYEEVDETTSSGSQISVLPEASYSIIRVVERNTGEELSPQLAFGKYYSSCYLTLYNNCTLELCLNPSAGITESGTYSIYGNTMYVDTGKDKLTEYSVVFGDNSAISYIVVSSGEFDVYFG